MLLFVSNAPPTTEIYTLSLHDALPISPVQRIGLVIDRKILRLLPKRVIKPRPEWIAPAVCMNPQPDRKSTRLNSSHTVISYAVFCLKKKKSTNNVQDCSVVTKLHRLDL